MVYKPARAPVIWEIVLLNLAEAHGDLLRLRRRLVYLDTGIPCSRQYFRCLFCFPRAFPDFWPKSVLAKKGRGEKNEHVVKVW